MRQTYHLERLSQHLAGTDDLNMEGWRGMKKRVLMVGTEDVLLRARASILQKRCEVSVSIPDEALTHLRTRQIELLIVCSATPSNKALEIIRRARDEFPHLYVVRLISEMKPFPEERAAHQTVLLDLEPRSWIEAIEPLLRPEAQDEPLHAKSKQRRLNTQPDERVESATT